MGQDTRRYTERELRAAMKRAGVEASPDLVRQVRMAMVSDGTLFAVTETAACLNQPRPATKRATTEWVQAASQPKSDAARAAVHDRINAPHRPGGKALPRPRWSVDKTPWGGWDDGTVRVRERKAAPKVITPAAEDGDTALAKIMAAMARRSAR